MKRILWFVAVAFAALILIGCSEKVGPATPVSQATLSAPAIAGEPEKVIPALENEWVAAIVNKNAAVIDNLIADDFSGTTDNQTYSKADAIEDVKLGTHESLNLSNIKVRVYGDTAVATMDQQEVSSHGGQDYSGRYLFTNVWVRRNGEWRVVASHGTRVR